MVSYSGGVGTDLVGKRLRRLECFNKNAQGWMGVSMMGLKRWLWKSSMRLSLSKLCCSCWV
jgi:hypothetical protein